MAGVFYRLNFIEQFGTEVMRIIDEYRQIGWATLNRTDLYLTWYN